VQAKGIESQERFGNASFTAHPPTIGGANGGGVGGIAVSAQIVGGELTDAPQPLATDEASRSAAQTSGLTLASTTNDDCWDKSVVDRLRVAPDARAFARLVASRAFNPPLAVGVFGRWGAGKSFFMRLVHDHIDRLSAGVPSREAPEANPLDFHGDIVQIRFNAWHYVETNLWASLVDHLFTQLALRMKGSDSEHSPLSQLGTARALTMEAAEKLASRRREQTRAEESVKAAEQALAEKRRAIKTDPELYAEALFEALKSGSHVAELRKASETLGLPALQTESEALGKSWADLKAELESGRALTTGLTKQFGTWWIPAVFLMLGAPFVISAALSAAGDASFRGFAVLTSGLASGLASVTALLGIAASTAKGAINKLKASAAVIEKVAETRVLEAKRELTDKLSEVDAAKLKVDESKAVYHLAQERLAQATEEFYSSTGAARLIKFIRTRASDGHYASHLGLIASVRRDLEELSRGLDAGPYETASEAETNKALAAQVDALVEETGLTDDEIETLRAQLRPRQAVEPPFKRLVLYIDDLDRCPTDKVVEVLQAVHMLLAFRLFVVFVAVDVRWVSQALLEHHPGLLAMAPIDGRLAAPGDYLEKIFQVPYWVRAVDQDGSRSLLDSLLPQNEASPSEAGRVNPVETGVLEITPRALEVSDAERRILHRLVPYVASSPRRILWLTNAYRLIKANDDYATELSTREAASQALITQLVLVAVDPSNFETWRRHLRLARSNTDVQTLLFALEHGWDQGSVPAGQENATVIPTSARNVFDVLTFGLDDPAIDVSLLKKYADLARRYSFATADSYSGSQGP